MSPGLTFDGPAVQLLTTARDLVAAAHLGLQEAAPPSWTGAAADQHAAVLAELRGAVDHLHEAVVAATGLCRHFDDARHEAVRGPVTP